MAVIVDPLTSQDGTPVSVVKTRGEGRAAIQDEAVLAQLTAIAGWLSKIHRILAFEFEQLDTEDNTED
jgi:hypothetical protein